MSYGKRVQLDSLLDFRQPMSTIQSFEIQLTPVLNAEQDLVRILSSFFKPSNISPLISSRNWFHCNFLRHSPFASIWPERRWKRSEPVQRPANDSPSRPASYPSVSSKSNGITTPTPNEWKQVKNQVWTIDVLHRRRCPGNSCRKKWNTFDVVAVVAWYFLAQWKQFIIELSTVV